VKSMKYINGIGLEVETVIMYDDYDSIYEQRYVSEVKEDGSLELNSELVDEGYEAWEIVSDILTHYESVDKFFNSIANYIVDDYINSTMGMHVHISLNKPVYYSVLFSSDFRKYILSELEREYGDSWFKSRIRNTYCRDNYGKNYFLDSFRHSGDAEVMDNYDRYKAINFICSWQKFQTFEFRIFPSTDSASMCEYVKFLLKYINKYLDMHLSDIDYNVSERLVSGSEDISSVEPVVVPSAIEIVV